MPDVRDTFTAHLLNPSVFVIFSEQPPRFVSGEAENPTGDLAMTHQTTLPYPDVRDSDRLRAKDDLWARAFCLPGGVTLAALLDWIETRP